jgi:hypothetical protein
LIKFDQAAIIPNMVSIGMDLAAVILHLTMVKKMEIRVAHAGINKFHYCLA